MRTVLIVTPHFPPINAPDMQRVRLSAPYLREFGWEPIVLSVDPQFVERSTDPLLVETVPSDLVVQRTAALSRHWTRKVGIGNIGIRAFPYMYRAGRRILRDNEVDLVFFSTTMFPLLPLGRLWKRQFGVPYVFDMQDPWVSDDSSLASSVERNTKYRVMQAIHRALEPWAMREVEGLMAVSEDYITTLRERYDWLKEQPAETLPFTASENDFDVLRESPPPNRIFQNGDGHVHGVYAGAAGGIMEFSLRIFFEALRLGREQHPELFAPVRLHFVGTNYASEDRARKTVEPIAEQIGVEAYVTEHPARIPYFEVLRLLKDSDFLLVPGSDNPQYTASKIFPYILARRPLLGAFHEQSSVVQIIRETNAGIIQPFEPERENVEVYARQLHEHWTRLLKQCPFEPDTNWEAFEKYTARAMTRRQCALFDRALQQTAE